MFVTLTYATEHLQFTRNGHPTIIKDDLQKFMKRLRKNQFGSNKGDVKYYAVGEYGGKLKRPHYHLILFNASHVNVAKSWNKGHVHFGQVEQASVGYTLKYISKPHKNFALNDDRERPFSLMSKGIGDGYLTKQMVEWHKKDLVNRMYVNLLDGKKASMPRYYKDRIYCEAEKEAIKKHLIDSFAESIYQDILKYSPDDYFKKQRTKVQAKEVAKHRQVVEVHDLYS